MKWLAFLPRLACILSATDHLHALQQSSYTCRARFGPSELSTCCCVTSYLAHPLQNHTESLAVILHMFIVKQQNVSLLLKRPLSLVLNSKWVDSEFEPVDSSDGVAQLFASSMHHSAA